MTKDSEYYKDLALKIQEMKPGTRLYSVLKHSLTLRGLWRDSSCFYASTLCSPK